MPAKKRSSVPLAWRVPNAPPTFVGRRDELRAIKAAVQRGPLVVLCGAGGLGKTALAAAAVRDVLADRASRAVMVSARVSEPFRQTLADVARALGSGEVRPDADMTMLAIDFAETRRALVVLDDLHHALPEATDSLVAIARYAKRSTWLAISRIPPEAPELVGQIVRVEPLGEKHLATLVRIIDPKLTRADAARVARDAHGSPWKARQLASEHSHTHVDEASKTLLATLSVVERPIGASALAGSVSRANGPFENVSDAVGELVRRGLVEEVAGGYRLHEAARPLIATWMTTAPEREKTIAALAAGGHAEAVEALRLALEARDEKRALGVCETSFDAMLRAGHAPTLWKLIGACQGALWGSYKLHAAMQLADVKITTLLDEPPSDALVDRLLWVRALFVEAKAAETVAAADALSEVAERCGDERIAFWAALERAMASRVHAGPERGLELLLHARPVDDATRALVAALSSFWLAEVGRIDASIRTLERTALERGAPLETPLADDILGGPLDFFVRYYRMAAFMECGHLDRAHNEITAGRASLDADDQLRASYIQLDGIANLSIARGRLDEAERILERLLRATPKARTSTYHTIARLLDVERRIAAGVFGSVGNDLDRLLDDTRRQNPLVFAWCVDTQERLHLVSAVREEAPLDVESSPVGAVARSVLRLRRALRRAHWGLPDEVPDAIDVEGSIIRELVIGTRELVSGGDASAHAERAIDLAAEHGWGVRECEGRQLLVEALVTSGETRRALVEARSLAKHAATMSSPRFETEARLLAALVDPPALDVAALEEIALADDVAPCAARRARSLFGRASLDAVDERVLGAARTHAKVEIVRVGATEVHRRGWGLDMRRAEVWLPDGRRVSMARHALLARVLEVLAREGGRASFETLSKDVWQQRRPFHALHDGNRIRVTLHRLRALVETDPAKPERIVLGGSSYELGGEPFTLVEARK